MRSVFLVSLTLVMTDAAFALEKVEVLDNSSDEDWAATSSCHIAYWNRCTLWGWSWDGDGNTVIGVRVDNDFDSDIGPFVSETRLWFFEDAPSGYGFTGTIALATIDANSCPSATIASKPFLPAGFPAIVTWYRNVWSDFAVVLTLVDGIDGAYNPVAFATDHPARGPTGPQACGFCYPANRVTHSFMWQYGGFVLCPGSPFFDGVCNAELRWTTIGLCSVAIEDTGWASIKAMYR